MWLPHNPQCRVRKSLGSEISCWGSSVEKVLKGTTVLLQFGSLSNPGPWGRYGREEVSQTLPQLTQVLEERGAGVYMS